jgi:hypothetical protein
MEILEVGRPRADGQNKNSEDSLEIDLSLNDLIEKGKVSQVYRDMIFFEDYSIET